MSDSCSVNLPIKLVKIRFFIYPEVPFEISGSQLSITGDEFIFLAQLFKALLA